MSSKLPASDSVILREECDDYAMPYRPERVEVPCLNPVGVTPLKRFSGRYSVKGIPGGLRSGFDNVPAAADYRQREYAGCLAKYGLIRAIKLQGA